MIRNFSAVLLATLLSVACASTNDDPNARAKRDAGIGAVAGAIAGGIIGNQTGNSRTGAVVGAAVGAGVGGVIGRRMDKQQQELRQIPGVEVNRTSENELNVQFQNDILFDVDSYSLRSDARTTLRDVASNVAQYPDESMSVEGHTDGTGTSQHNMTLSQQRADSVLDYLVSSGGVPSSRITARGFGETSPKESNSTPEGRQLNRRVEIHIRANGQ